MFISKTQIVRSLKVLESIHAFYGVTFLTCKKHNLPVGDSIPLLINQLEDEFLNTYYKPDSSTSYYYRPFRVAEKKHYWWRYDYSRSGSQSTRTRSFSEAFIHERNTTVWGWQKNYVDVLAHKLNRGTKISIFDLAVWIYRDVAWEETVTRESVIRRFLYEFNITSEEYEKLFRNRIELSKHNPFSPYPVLWEEIREEIGAPPPPDARIDEGGSLRMLITEGTGPAEKLEVNFSSRINAITGDNGLGKTFLLETAWWALTGFWSDKPMYPSYDFAIDPRITFQIASSSNRIQTVTASFDRRAQNWALLAPRSVNSGLVIYARVDGSFSVWDPIRSSPTDTSPSPLHFSKKELWGGLKASEFAFNDRYIANGLISDWVLWQNNPSTHPFQTLRKVLKQLSPPKGGDLGLLEPGYPRRVIGESRPIPTIRHTYGEVPLTQASEAVKRIVGLAYMIVWTWSEHLTQADIIGERPQKKMVVIIDEIEAHLHPKWQRLILPALNETLHSLEKELSIQIIATTHSPLVLGSLEPIFNQNEDSIFHLDILEDSKSHKVTVEDLDFIKYGSVDSWLKSPIFDLPQAMAEPYEEIVETAKKYMADGGKSREQIIKISAKLLEALPNHDLLVMRWKMYANKHGVEI